MKHIAVFASGSGSNFQRLAEYFANHAEIQVSLILSNKPDAFVLDRAKKLHIPAYTFSATDFRESDLVLIELLKHSIDFIVLAGFLLRIPPYLLLAYPRKIINIHPALLPKYGGKGMYGNHVHEAVIAAGEKESGISIHQVNENYDEGDILFQARCPVFSEDTPETLAQRVHQLEYEHYPRVVEVVVLRGIC